MNTTANILLVNADAEQRLADRQILEAAGYEVHEASHAHAALQAARAHQPDLMLVERDLPEMAGPALCQQVKTAPELSDVYVLLLCGTKPACEEDPALQCGADGFIPRPVTSRDLLARVNATLHLQGMDKTLREIEDKFKYIFDHSNVAKSLTSPRRGLQVNQAFCDLVGYTREELAHLAWQEISHPGDIEVTQQRIEPLLNGQQESVRFEKRYLHRDGRTIWGDVSTSVRRDAAGNVLYFMTTVIDITERKRVEEELRLLSSRQEALLAAVPDIIMEVNNDKVYTWANQAGLRFFGEDVIGREAAYYFNGEQDTYASVKPVFNGDTNIIYLESWQRRYDGQKRLLAWWCRSLKDPDGHVIGALSSARDITESSRAAQELRLSEQRLATLIGNLPGFVYRCANDHDWTMEFISDGCQAVTGYSPEDFIHNRKIAYNDIVHPDLRENLWQKWQDVLSRHASFEAEYPIITLSGETRWVWERGGGVFSGSGELLYLEGFITDITRQKQSEFERQAMLEISQGLTSTQTLHEYLGCIHQALAKVIVAKNFYVIIHDKETGLFEEVYSVDEYDEPFPPSMLEKSICAYVFRSSKPLLLNQERFDVLASRGEVELMGTNSPSWLGVPLILDQETIGVMAVQEYERDGCYSEHDQDFLMAVAGQVAQTVRRRQVEDTIRLSEARYHSLVESQVEVVSRSTTTGVLSFVNNSYCRTFGLTRQQAIGRTFAASVHPEDMPLMRQVLLEIQQPPHRRIVEIRNLTVDGLRWFEWDNSAVLDEQGRIIEFQGVGRDITARKQVESALRESEERHRKLVENQAEGVGIVDPQERFRYVNPAAEVIFGVGPGELIGRSLKDFTGDAQYEQITTQTSQRKEGENSTYEVAITRPDGSQRILLVTASPDFDREGNFVGSYGVFRDITERKQAEEEILRLNSELERRVEDRTRDLHTAQEQLVRQERLAVLGQLAGSVGHELRNPLGVISNAIYYLKLIQPEADARVRQYLGVIEQETHTASKIIGDLLDFARLKSLACEQVEVSELVRRTLEHFPVPTGVKLIIRLPADLHPVYADPGHMVQVLGNLVTNACQAMENGGRLSITAAQKKEEIAILVRDTGTGISPENINKLFEPLFTTKTKGIGLGLPVSQKLVEANGGRIEVKSEFNKGSTFTVFLPQQEVSRG